MEYSAAMQRWAASGGSEVDILTLEMTNAAFDYKGGSGRIMLVNAELSHTFVLETGASAVFHPAGFAAKETDSGFNVVIPGGGIDAIDQLEKWADSDGDADIDIVFRTYLLGIEGPQRIARGRVGSPKVDEKSALVFTAKYLTFESLAFPNVLYSKLTHQGL